MNTRPLSNEFSGGEHLDAALRILFGPEAKMQAQARKLSEREHRELIGAVKFLTAEQSGQRFLWWLLEQTHVFQTSFTGNSSTFFLEGERNIGLKCFALAMEADPAFMQKLIDYKREKDAALAAAEAGVLGG